MKETKLVLVSGGFDPIHVGHIRHIQAAKKLGDILLVIVNSDEDMTRKKGYCFMPLVERMEIVKSIKGVDIVAKVTDTDGSSAETIRLYCPDIFAKGGDRNPTDNPIPQSEIEACEEVGCEIVYNVGDEKIQSSSALVKAMQIVEEKQRKDRTSK